MRLIRWIIILLAVVVVAVVGVANRDTVSFNFDPLPFTMELPLYLVLYAGIVLGLLVGLGSEWWRGRRARREARQRRREADLLRQELAALKAAGHPPIPPA